MNSSKATFAFVAVLGGASGSALTMWATDQSPAQASAVAEADQRSFVKTKRPDESQVARPAAAPVSSARMATLERRVSLLTAALARSQGGVALREEDGTTTDVADPVFEAAVLDIMDRQQEQKESENTERRESERKEQSHRYAERLNTSMGLEAAEELDDEQKQKVAEVVSSYFDRMRKIRQGDPASRPVTRAEWRERMMAVTKTSEDELLAVLTTEQKSKYEELEDDEKFGFGRFSGPRSPQKKEAASQEKAAQ